MLPSFSLLKTGTVNHEKTDHPLKNVNVKQVSEYDSVGFDSHGYTDVVFKHTLLPDFSIRIDKMPNRCQFTFTFQKHSLEDKKNITFNLNRAIMFKDEDLKIVSEFFAPAVTTLQEANEILMHLIFVASLCAQHRSFSHPDTMGESALYYRSLSGSS